MRFFGRIATCVALVLGPGASRALADSFSVSYLGAGVQAPTATSHYETFTNASLANGSYVTTFAGSSVTGTYTGSLLLESAGVYGGAGDTGKYASTAGTYTLSLSSAVNYFGLWFSALDAGNQMLFYNTAISTTTPVYSFLPTSYSQLVGVCPSSANAYCGNPNAAFAGSSNDNAGQQYAYLNFFDTTGSFNEIVFTENGGGGEFESDNHAVANLTSGPGGTALTAVTPEPAGWVLAMSGAAGLLTVPLRRVRARA